MARVSRPVGGEVGERAVERPVELALDRRQLLDPAPAPDELRFSALEFGFLGLELGGPFRHGGAALVEFGGAPLEVALERPAQLLGDSSGHATLLTSAERLRA